MLINGVGSGTSLVTWMFNLQGIYKMIRSCLIMWNVLLAGQLWFVMQFEDTKAQQIIWIKLNETMLKHGFPKPNFEGFMVDSAQTNWNMINIIYFWRIPLLRWLIRNHLFIPLNHLINTSNINRSNLNYKINTRLFATNTRTQHPLGRLIISML